MKLTVFMFFLCAVTIGKSQNYEGLSFGTDSTLDIVTWNIEWFPKNGQTTKDNVQEIINALEPDVLALQEIDSKTEFFDMVANLEGYGGYYSEEDYTGLAYIYNESSLTILNVFEILTSYSREFPRKPYVLHISFLGNDYYIINNHLKASGDGTLDLSDEWDEETRRYDACVLIANYIEDNLNNENVVVVGDLNDEVTDYTSDNVFQAFINAPSEYLITDMDIAEGSSSNWSYPDWPSHLDHIIISNELFDEFETAPSTIEVLKPDDYVGWYTYDSDVTDHRPVGLKLKVSDSSGANELSELNAFTIFPNPASKSIQLKLSKHSIDPVFELYDLTGQVLISKSIESINSSIDLSGIANGSYIVKVYTENQYLQSQKLIIHN